MQAVAKAETAQDVLHVLRTDSALPIEENKIDDMHGIPACSEVRRSDRTDKEDPAVAQLRTLALAESLLTDRLESPDDTHQMPHTEIA